MESTTVGSQGSNPLACSICGTSHRDDLGRGCLRWWRTEARTIVRVEVTCFGPCTGASWAEGGARGEYALDGQLDEFTGRWSLVQLERLLRLYTWTEDASEQLLTVLEELRTMPDGEGPRWLGM